MDLPKTYSPEETEKRWYGVWESAGYFQPRSGLRAEGSVMSSELRAQGSVKSSELGVPGSEGTEPTALSPEPPSEPGAQSCRSEPGAQSPEPSFCIVIPPPNVTGSLHMGHALNNTLQDVLVRWRRMQERRTLWVPGTDHGGIATQNVVEKLLKTEKKTRHDLGRQAFLERMWQWRKESGDIILMQLRRLGASCDWTRTRFTMDEVCSRAVREAFVRLFQKGLIYRGPRMVNWCPRCHTALADIEVEHEERAGKLWHIRYPLSESSRLQAPGQGVAQSLEPRAPYVVVATTRPETLLGDTAVAVNPDDPRYQTLIGQKLRLPLTSREIPIVADSAVDAAFGTGAVKVTPAHDPADFEIAERQNLPHVVVINFEGKMTPEAGAKYAGLDRFACRKQVVEDLEAQGLMEKTEDYRLAAATCYRCQTVVEPLVSEQWFLSMSGLAARAADATRQGRLRIIPNSWEKPYLLWLENIRDWCISRQIWWGHRIPVYYCSGLRAVGSVPSEPGAPSPELFTEHGAQNPEPPCKPIASVEKPEKCPSCGSHELTQDEDVLDTWFSSALWPFSVFAWPDQTADLKTFYPTSVLVTGNEILYLWVARMVMMGLEFLDKVPFHQVYIHGIVRDKHGKKMSKSLGNVIDPLEIMKQYGTDALRMSLAESSVPGRDMQLSQDSFLKARNFANKLWNASRFVLMNLNDYRPPTNLPADSPLVDRWIAHQLYGAIRQVTEALESYNPAEAARTLYDFVWSSFCDWYVELAKIRLQGNDAGARGQTQAVLAHVLENILALLHPIMPYETEEIYSALTPFLVKPAPSIMIHPWPRDAQGRPDPAAAAEFERLQEVIVAMRTVRSEMNVPPGARIEADVRCTSAAWVEQLRRPEWTQAIQQLARVSALRVETDLVRPPESGVAIFQGGEVYIPLKGLIDTAKEKARLRKNLQTLEQAIARDDATFQNDDFRRRAPQEEVDRLTTRLRQARDKVALLERNLQGL